MKTPSNEVVVPEKKKYMLTLKRQHGLDAEAHYVEDDAPLDSSVIINGSSFRRQIQTPSSSSGSSSDEDEPQVGSPAPGGEAIDEDGDRDVQRSPAPASQLGGEAADEDGGESPRPGPSSAADEVPEVAAGKIRCESPRPGPSAYEDISFEPAVTSTPHPQEDEDEDEDEDVKISESADECQNESVIERELRLVKEDMRDGKALISRLNCQFLHETRRTLKRKSATPINTLTERRRKLAKRMTELRKRRQTIDNLLESLSDQTDAIDDAIHNFNYFIEHFPFMP